LDVYPSETECFLAFFQEVSSFREYKLSVIAGTSGLDINCVYSLLEGIKMRYKLFII